MTTWDALEQQVRVVGTKFVNSPEDCRLAVNDLQLPGLPPSYQEYVARFGAGEWRPDLVIAAPRHPNRYLTLAFAIKGLQKMTPPLPRKPKLTRLLPFGGHADGYHLCWDTDSLMDNGEMSICLLQEHEQEPIIYCGNTLLEFLAEYWIGRKLDQVYPLQGGSWNCNPEFRAIGQ